MDFVNKEGALYLGESARQIIPKIKELAQKMRKPASPVRASPAGGQGAAIIYLTDSHQPDDREFQLFPPHRVKKTPGAQVI